MWRNRATKEDRDTRIGLVAFVAAILAALTLNLSGAADGLESASRDIRDSLRLTPTTGDIVVVEIDGRSLQALDTFPWPRSHHATAVKELERLGATQIAFDVDFSARSDPREDAQFAKALAALDQPAILATFRQYNQSQGQSVVSEALPIPALRDHSFMASVNVHPSSDGKIIQYPHGVTTKNTPRPSLANMLAKSGGEIDASFQIDQAIDMRSIPRVSFVDLLEGKVPRAMIAGKQAVIGATAIELGDRYPTALFGVQPGVFVHVQAAETLIQGRNRNHSSQWPALALAALLLAGFVLARNRSGKGAQASSGFAAGLAGLSILGALALDQITGPYIALSSALFFLIAFVGLRRVLVASENLSSARMTNAISGLPNRFAMQKSGKSKNGATIAVARVADINEIAALLDEEHWGEFSQAVARRLRLMSDVHKVFHLGSGLYGWYLSDAQANDPASAFASARSLFNSPIEIANERFRVITHFGTSTETIADAEDASELARKRGLVWSGDADALHQETQFRQRMLGELDDALGDGSISVVFQPKLRLKDGAYCAGECLIRWHSKQLGQIPPSQFIPILEQKGRIDVLTLFVLKEAIRRRDEVYAQGKEINLAVNVSAQLLSDDRFVDAAVALLKKNAVKALGGVTLEITESAPLSDSDTAHGALERLAHHGARISIDDYGTGQASLNYLQDFPAEEIKLDQSFVRNLAADKKDRIMVQSTIELAHALGFDIVAEGVEDEQTLAILIELGCDYGQGWAIGHPMEWDQFAECLGQKRSLDKAA